jgi:hypothetical protein
VGRGIIQAEKAYLGGSDYDNSCYNELDSFPDDWGPGIFKRKRKRIDM